MAIRVRSDAEGYPIKPLAVRYYDKNGASIGILANPPWSEFRFERPTPYQPDGAAYRVILYEPKPSA
jgi:hypothetical protein